MATASAIRPGRYGFPVTIRKQYDNYIGGQWVAPASGQYFRERNPGDRAGALRDRPFQRRGR